MPNLSHLWPASDTTSTTRSLCGQKPATSDRYPTPICAHPRLQRPTVGGREPRQHPQRRFRSATASHGGRARITTAAPAEAVSRDSSGSNGGAAPREGAAPRTTAVMAAMTAMTAMAAIPPTTRTAATSLPLPPPSHRRDARPRVPSLLPRARPGHRAPVLLLHSHGGAAQMLRAGSGVLPHHEHVIGHPHGNRDPCVSAGWCIVDA